MRSLLPEGREETERTGRGDPVLLMPATPATFTARQSWKRPEVRPQPSSNPLAILRGGPRSAGPHPLTLLL